MSESERNAMFDDCFTYDDELRKTGIGRARSSSTRKQAMTVSWKNGKVAVTDGLTWRRRQLGGILVLEARDLNHAFSSSPNIQQ